MLIDKPRYEWFQQGAVFGQDESLRVFRPIEFKAGRESGYPYLAHGSIGSDDKFRGRLVENKLMLYQAKTGTPVFVPLPPHVADLLRSIPAGLKPNPNYFFWSGNGLPKTFVANWQRAYRRLFKVADLRKPDGTPKRCHCHMFRDTFAVEMLLAGVPIDQVSILLGHASVRVTEKHYSPWVRARQDQLEKSVQSAWQLSSEGIVAAS